MAAYGTDQLPRVPETSSNIEILKHAITINQIIARFTTAGISLDHGLLVGLTDDDHTQYYNSARLTAVLASYYTIAAADAAFAPLVHTHASTGITDFAEAVDDRVYSLLVAGQGISLTYDDGANTLTVKAKPRTTIGATWGGSAAVDASSAKTVPVLVPRDCTIVGVRVYTIGGTGSCVVDIWKDTHANYPPTVADTITASAKPTIASGTKYSDDTLTGWTTSLSANDVLMFKLDSSSTFTHISVFLIVE